MTIPGLLGGRAGGALAIAPLCFMALAGGAPMPAAAAATDGTGNYTQILCANPSSGQGVGVSGLPEGLSNPSSTVLWQISASDADCGEGPITPARGVPMLVGQSNTYPQGTWSALMYQAAPQTSINGGVIYRAEKAEGANAGYMGIVQQGGEESSLYSLPRNCCDEGDWFAGNVASRGTFAEPFAAQNAVELTISPDAEHWDVNATCDPNGNNNSSCALSAGQWEYRIFGGVISLHAGKDPQAGEISGPLTSDEPLRGAESLSFSATDEGPGLAYVSVVLDGTTLEREILDSNDGRCLPVSGTDSYTWAYQLPCKTSLGGRTYSLETAALPNGPHHIQVVIEDAAGNESEVLNRTVAVENPGAASVTAPIAPSGSLLVAGTANGLNAGSEARLTLGLPRAVSRPYARSRLRVPGRLTNGSGQAIIGATLEVSEQVAGHAATVLGHAETGSDGAFVANVPAGPSRRIEISYRAFSGESGRAADASVSESVGAGVQMHVTPRRTGPDGTITLAGSVAGPVPRAGVVLELLVHYRGHWVPFRAPRTDRHGRFQVRYSFQGAVGRFPFRALVFAGQAGFPFGGGQSAVLDVETR